MKALEFLGLVVGEFGCKVEKTESGKIRLVESRREGRVSLLSGLLNDAKQLRQVLTDVYNLQTEVFNLQQLTMERMNAMSVKGQELKDLVAGIGTDVSEIDGDMDEVLAKINAINDLPTEAEWTELKDSLTAMKGHTSALAAKVPEPPPPPAPIVP